MLKHVQVSTKCLPFLLFLTARTILSLRSTAALYAADEGHDAIVHLLVSQHGADIHAVDNDGQSLLHLAAFEGKGSTVELLASFGAAVGVQDSDGERPQRQHVNSFQGYASRLICALDNTFCFGGAPSAMKQDKPHCTWPPARVRATTPP